MAWDVGDHILIPIPLHSTPHQLSNDMTFVHVDIEFIHLPSFPALLSSDVSMSVCVDVVVAPIYCSFMDAIAPSSTHTYLATLVFTVMDVGFMVIIKNISILVLVLVYGVLVFPYLHSAVTLLQAYAALLTLSISDMLAAPLQRNQLNEDQNTRIQHSILSPIAFIHDDWISPIRINTQSIHYTHAVTETIVVVLSYVCLFFTIDWYLFVALFIIFLVKSLVLNYLFLFQLFMVPLKLIVLAPLPLSIIDIFAALIKSEIMITRKPYILCLQPHTLSITDFICNHICG